MPVRAKGKHFRRARGKVMLRKETREERVAAKRKARAAIAELNDDDLERDLLDLGKPRTFDYHPKYARLASVVVSVYGSTAVELARVFGVPIQVIAMWMNRHSDFRDAVEDAARNCNVNVMNRLFRQCMGFSYQAEKLFYDGKRGKVVRATYREYVKPETSAQIFWLKNRMPDKWQDKPLESEQFGKQLAADIAKVFETELAPDAAIETYNKLLEIEAKAVETRPALVTFTPKREKPKVEKSKATDAEYVEREGSGAEGQN